MAHTLPSSDQSSDQDKWDSGGLECKGQLLIKIVMRNRLTALVVDGDTTCWVLEQELLHSYGVQTLGVDNSRDAVDLIASDAEFNLIIIEKILPVLNGLAGCVVRCWRSQLAREKVKGRPFWQLVLMCSLRDL
ncbi:hypothetical protein ERO13_D07G208350v2 [Gossypium hirsutum]|uniref:Uncharacterized protein isoform X2 n=1 Tax=Gossypium hirsutum TaxID=3635 RepID=A0A1U8LBT4_GOSHI|nr:uncharacterized protein LOC107925852 isoform X2 [Gossypium hirsutum]KAG4139676.1 hypothetical protein ERO13_D07G208350v2 [Gossypium hirsutum]